MKDYVEKHCSRIPTISMLSFANIGCMFIIKLTNDSLENKMCRYIYIYNIYNNTFNISCLHPAKTQNCLCNGVSEAILTAREI